LKHRVAGRKLSRPTAHRWALYRNLVADLVKYEKIVTTEAKAKEIRGLAEKMITLGKEGSLWLLLPTPNLLIRFSPSLRLDMQSELVVILG
jgi:hypothetical protein